MKSTRPLHDANLIKGHFQRQNTKLKVCAFICEHLIVKKSKGHPACMQIYVLHGNGTSLEAKSFTSYIRTKTDGRFEGSSSKVHTCLYWLNIIETLTTPL